MRFELAVCAVLAGTLVSGGPALAQDASLLAPDIGAEFTSPRYFEGLYVGAGFAMLSGHPNYWSPLGGEIAYGGELTAGYGHYLTDNVVLSGELTAAVGTDFAGNIRYDVLAMAHLGVLAGPYFRPYAAGGLGWFQGTPSWAAGMGAEWAVWDNLSVQAEFLTLGQLGPSPTGLWRNGISAYHIKTGVVWHFGDDKQADGVFSPTGEVTDFTGLYAGAYTAVAANPNYNIFFNTGNGLHMSRGSYGLAGGWNFGLADGIVAGLEVQGGVLFNGSGDLQGDALLLARAGIVPFQGLFVYGQGGVGRMVNSSVYALGAGVEWAAFGNAGLRADVLAIGEISPALPADSGFTAAKVLVGPVWHFD